MESFRTTDEATVLLPASPSPRRELQLQEDSTMTTSASHSSDSSDADNSQRPAKIFKQTAPRRPKKLHKNSYWARKDEMERLVQQMSELSAQLDLLKQHKPQTEDASDVILTAEKEYCSDDSTHQVAAENARLRKAVQSQQWALWGAHSTFSDWMNQQFVNPISSFIHLGFEPLDRRKTMLRMKDRRIDDGLRFVAMRSAKLNPLEPHYSENRGMNTEGDFCSMRFEVRQFYGVRSVKQVFDAVVESMLAMEITISEALGGVIVREDFDTMQNGICNHRLLSTGPSGLRQEKNSASFAQFEALKVHEDCEEPGFGILVSDFVDVDDLYPYRPLENFRRDVTGVTLLTPHRKLIKRTQTDGRKAETTELVVTMHRSMFVKVHRPQFDVDDAQLRSMHVYSMSWGEVIAKSAYDHLEAMGIQCR